MGAACRGQLRLWRAACRRQLRLGGAACRGQLRLGGSVQEVAQAPIEEAAAIGGAAAIVEGSV